MTYRDVYKMVKKASETQQKWWSGQGAKKGLSIGARIGGGMGFSVARSSPFFVYQAP